MFPRPFFQTKSFWSPRRRTPSNQITKPSSRVSGVAVGAVVIVLFLTMTACNTSPTVEVAQPNNATTPTPETQSTDPPTPTTTPSPTETPEPTEEDTLTPTPTSSPTPTASATLPANNVTGNICFPGGEIPEMTVYLEETENETLVKLAIKPGQTSFEANLSPGTYIAYAWLKDFSRGGLYSRAVACGSGSECDDHSLLPFRAEMREVTTGVDVCDWFAGPFNVPYPPGIERAELTGNITGNLSYIEDEEIPELRIVAFNQNTEYWYWVYTQAGQTAYTLTELPPGIYHLVAYDSQGRAGGHADRDHNLIDVAVESGETTGGVNITDWSAARDAFPPDPTR